MINKQLNQDREQKNIHPLHVIKLAENSVVMVQLKSGQTYNGTIKMVDKFTNIKLENVLLTNKNGDKFHLIKEIYIRGNAIKYMKISEQILQKVQETSYANPKFQQSHNKRKRTNRQEFASLQPRKKKINN